VVCGAGTYAASPLSATACVDCAAGKYLASTGSDAETDCVACAAGADACPARPFASMSVSPSRYTCLISISIALIAAPPSRWPCLFELHPRASLYLCLRAYISLMYLHLHRHVHPSHGVSAVTCAQQAHASAVRGEFGSAQAIPLTL